MVNARAKAAYKKPKVERVGVETSEMLAYSNPTILIPRGARGHEDGIDIFGGEADGEAETPADTFEPRMNF